MVSLFQATCLTKNFTRGLIILLSDLRDEGFHEWSHYSPAVLKRKPSAIFFSNERVEGNERQMQWRKGKGMNMESVCMHYTRGEQKN